MRKITKKITALIMSMLLIILCMPSEIFAAGPLTLEEFKALIGKDTGQKTARILFVNSDKTAVSGGVVTDNKVGKEKTRRRTSYNEYGVMYDQHTETISPSGGSINQIKTEEGDTFTYDVVIGQATSGFMVGEAWDILERTYEEVKTPPGYKPLGGEVSYSINYDATGLKITFDDTNRAYVEGNTLYIVYEDNVMPFMAKMIPVGGSKDDAAPKSGVQITVNGKTYTSDTDGIFELKREDENTAAGYTFTAADAADYQGSSTSFSQAKSDGYTIYVNERQTQSDSDYEIVGAYNGYVAKPEEDTEYTIRGNNGIKLSLTQRPPGEDEIKVTLTPDGHTTTFYGIKNDIASRPIIDAIKIDQTAPEVTIVKTEAVNGKLVNIIDHGIYSKQRADLLVTVELSELESGYKSASLVGEDKNGKTHEYPQAKIEEIDGRTVLTFAIESQEEMLKEKLSLQAVDNVGNKTEKILLRGTDDPSTITLEMFAPEIGEIKTTNRRSNEYGWINILPSFSVDVKDEGSGIANIKATINEIEVYDEVYQTKETGVLTAKFSLSDAVYNEGMKSTGEYTVVVTVTDNSGNINSKKKTVKVDLEAPTSEIIGIKNDKIYRSVPAVTVSEEESHYKEKGNKLVVKVTCDDKETYSHTFSGVNSAKVPASAFKKDGSYKVTLTATDAAGNKAEKKTVSFIHDSTAPVISISAPAEKWHTTKQQVTISVSERWYKTNKVTINVIRDLNGKKYSYTFPWKNSGKTSSSSMSFGDTGKYTVTVTATDKAGNKAAQKSASFYIDTVAPELNIAGIEESKTYQYDDLVAPYASFSDDYVANVSYEIKKANQDWKDNLPGSIGKSSITWPDFDKLKDNDGLYSISVTVKDEAGNETAKAISFIVNRFGSWYEYDGAANAVIGKALQSVNEPLTIKEYNVSKLKSYTAEVRLDGSPVTEVNSQTDHNSGANGVNIYSHLFNTSNFEKEGVYEINVISEDEAGNKMESKEENGKIKFTVDKTAPAISAPALDERFVNAESLHVPITITDNLTKYMASAYIGDQEVEIESTEQDGKIIEMWITVPEGMNQTIKIMAEDEAGNSQNIERTVSVTSSGIKYFFSKFRLPALLGFAALGVLAGFLLLKRKKGKEKAEK